ncbi:unnamed protein product [Urochloa decumbens]|uniref:LysM domain-containing protein n=1 Tax=Urochloa decumbens TaxID=240449 RepID=A0ABC8X4S9_9POAL
MPSLAARLAVPAAALLLLFLAAPASATNFTCATPGATCQSAIGYAVPNATTYAELAARFNTTTTLAELLGANNLPTTTSPSAPIAAKTTLRIPFRCSCGSKGVGHSDGGPIYVVQPQDGLDHIAREVFDAFVTYQEVATANNITDVNLIYPVCRSSISNTSADHNLLLPNGTYALTAEDCMQCSCSANNYEQLSCTSVQRSRCPTVPPCDGGLKLGEKSGAGCESKMCAYTGYSKTTSLSIHTGLVTANQTACNQKGGAARSEFAGSVWRMSVISFHMVLILICFL